MEKLIGRKIEMTCEETEYGYGEYLGQTGEILRVAKFKGHKSSYYIVLESGKEIKTLRNRFKYLEASS